MNPDRLRTARLRSRHARTMRVVCSWCNGIIRGGNPDLPTSHGICPTCCERVEHGGALAESSMSTNINGG